VPLEIHAYTIHHRVSHQVSSKNKFPIVTPQCKIGWEKFSKYIYYEIRHPVTSDLINKLLKIHYENTARWG
jgi:hypothetical protein